MDGCKRELKQMLYQSHQADAGCIGAVVAFFPAYSVCQFETGTSEPVRAPSKSATAISSQTLNPSSHKPKPKHHVAQILTSCKPAEARLKPLNRIRQNPKPFAFACVAQCRAEDSAESEHQAPAPKGKKSGRRQMMHNWDAFPFQKTWMRCTIIHFIMSRPAVFKQLVRRQLFDFTSQTFSMYLHADQCHKS